MHTNQPSQDTHVKGWVHLLVAGLILAVGLLLLAFMIVVEDEPGALPLAMVLLGSTWLFLLLRKQRKK
ncbi:MAG: hypothetical protein COV99_12035 [Bacteroidetes bacterium CG12_big_fil_rev_8_21_14_0_65_60_17]|nr:MAG: hypothetical protein COV99_12035 [Bacteroidetes bacterium CG12_big_fil_rev_8_21_14_0_65_60_17]